MVVLWEDLPGAPVRSTDATYFPPAVHLEELRLLGLPHGAPARGAGLRLLLLSRPNARRALPAAFVDDVVEHLRSVWEVERFDGGHYTLREQARAFATADAVLGVSGAGLTNAVFLPAHAGVIMLLGHDLGRCAGCEAFYPYPFLRKSFFFYTGRAASASEESVKSERSA